MDLPSYQKNYLKSIFDTDLSKFDCDLKLLNYFNKEAKDVENELNTKSYFLHEEGNDVPLVGFSISNHVLEACIDIDMGIVEHSRYEVYPAVLIGRFATHKKYIKKGLGELTLALIKNWFISENKTGCRFIIVDSRPESKGFYIKCGFEEYPESDSKNNKNTILLYLDLRAYKSEIDRLK